MAEGNQTKAIIGQTFVSLCESEDPSKISIQELAEQAQINRQTFYYHFPDKKALIRWIYQTDALICLTAEDISLDNWEEAALKMLKRMKQHSTFYRKSVAYDRDILINEFYHITEPLFQRLFKEVDVEQQLSEQDVFFYSRFFSYGCSGILETWIRDDFPETPLEVATQLFRLAKDVEFFSYQIYQEEQSS
jgi:AcrR family transcriptional regulator